MAHQPSSREDEKTGGIQVIARAAKILNALGEQPGGMSLGEIAQAVELPRSTVQRIVAALDSAELVRSSGAGGLRLGPALLKLISSVHTDVVDLVSPLLENSLPTPMKPSRWRAPAAVSWRLFTTWWRRVSFGWFRIWDSICRSTAPPVDGRCWRWSVKKMYGRSLATPGRS